MRPLDAQKLWVNMKNPMLAQLWSNYCTFHFNSTYGKWIVNPHFEQYLNIWDKMQFNTPIQHKLINKQISMPLICSTMACRSSYVRGTTFLIFYMWKEQGLVVKPYKKCSLALALHLNLRQYKHCKWYMLQTNLEILTTTTNWWDSKEKSTRNMSKVNIVLVLEEELVIIMVAITSMRHNVMTNHACNLIK